MSQAVEHFTPITVEQASDYYPNTAKLAKAARANAGELFVESTQSGLVYGTIADNGEEPVEFGIQSDHDTDILRAVIKSDSGYYCQPMSGSGADFSWPIESAPEQAFPAGDYSPILCYMVDGTGNLPEVFASHDANEAAELPRLQPTIAIGDTACTAFAIGRTLREISEEPSQIHASSGLLLANAIDGYYPHFLDWGHTKEREYIREVFEEHAMLPFVLGKMALSLDLSGIAPRAVANRVPFFGFGLERSTRRMYGAIHQKAQTDGIVKNRLRRERLECGYDNTLVHDHNNSPEHYDQYMNTAIRNILQRQLGIRARNVVVSPL
jgi:hypothetical protein